MAAGIVREVRPMVAERKLVRVQDKGQVTLSAGVRKRLGLKKGDLVVVQEMAAGVLLTPQLAVITDALDRLGAILREEGRTLDELIESGRAIRGELVREMDGLDPDEASDPRPREELLGVDAIFDRSKIRSQPAELETTAR